MPETMILAAAILAIATLYSSVGHAGASGYLAAMALVTSLPQDDTKAIALSLNIVVGTIGAWRFIRAGHFDLPTFWPFALGAIPMAFVGGLWHLPSAAFRMLIGVVLLFAAVMLVERSYRPRPSIAEGRPPRPRIGVPIGAGLGLVAGLTGTGGGIFLSPLLVLCGWASPQRTAAVSVVFVLLNSIAGLIGVMSRGPSLPSALWVYAIAAAGGAVIGSGLGARHLPGRWIRMLLAVVLAIAAVKMFV